MPKYWMSDGDEQKLLEKLLRDGTISPSMRPSEVQPKYTLFDGFSANVFRKHWNLTKKKLNSGCKFV